MPEKNDTASPENDLSQIIADLDKVTDRLFTCKEVEQVGPYPGGHHREPFLFNENLEEALRNLRKGRDLLMMCRAIAVKMELTPPHPQENRSDRTAREELCSPR